MRFQPSKPMTPPGSLARKILWVVFFAAFTLTYGCAGADKTKVESTPQSPVAQATQQQSPVPQQQKAPLPPPDLNQIQLAVKRVFKDSALIETARKPSYVAGDFNGDLSQDIAVVIKPAPGKLAAMNEEYPAWILRDIVAPDASAKSPVRVAENDVLLAVIHGYGPDGWRDSQATQTFLLKNAAGSDISVQSGKEFVAANSDKKLPPVNGDLIGEVLRGKPGYLYYAHATYAWYDPKAYKEEPLKRVGHERGMKK